MKVLVALVVVIAVAACATPKSVSRGAVTPPRDRQWCDNCAEAERRALECYYDNLDGQCPR
ncbi:MAG TPA: hypothetical protein VKP14_07590 [Gaiellaceae bacterium]|nr:hypothetical protein [Gaiellaceae bacterium]